jgi:hypothetical protein
MPATMYDRRGLDDLIAAHTDRLRILQLQAAHQGGDTPPHVVTEIDRIERELAQLRQAAATVISSALVEELGPTGRYQLWMSHIMRLDTDIGRVRRDLERIEGKIDSLHDKFDKALLSLVAQQRRRRVP